MFIPILWHRVVWLSLGNQSADQLPRPSNLFSAADVLDVDGLVNVPLRPPPAHPALRVGDELFNVPLRPPPARTASIVGDKEKLKADLVPQPSNPNEAGDIMDTAGLINVPLRPPPGKPSSGLVHRQYNQIAASSIVDIEGLMNMPLRLPPARPAAKAGEERRLSVTKVPRPYIQIEESEVIDGEELINVPLRAPPVHPAGMPGAPTMDAASIDSGSDEMQRWEVDDDRDVSTPPRREDAHVVGSTEESFDTLSVGEVVGVAAREQDAESRFNFAREERKRLQGKFDFLLKTFLEKVPSEEQKIAMVREGLVNADAGENVFRAVYEMKLRRRYQKLQYEYPYNEDLDEHLVTAMRRMAEKLAYLAKRRIDLIDEAQKTLQELDVLEAMQDPYVVLGFNRHISGPPNPARQSIIDMSILYLGCRIEAAAVHLLTLPRTEDWPRAWFINLSLDMRHLTYLLPSAVSQMSHSPPLPACFDLYSRGNWAEAAFQNELRRIPIAAFKMVDNVPKLVPEWTPESHNKYDGFSTPWWLDGGMDYQSTSDGLRSGGLTAVARAYFKNLWPTDRSPIAVARDSIREQNIAVQIERLKQLEITVERLTRQINHIFSRLIALADTIDISGII